VGGGGQGFREVGGSGGILGWLAEGFLQQKTGQVAVQIIGYNSASNWAIYCFIAFTCFVCGLVEIFFYIRIYPLLQFAFSLCRLQKCTCCCR